MQSARIHPNDDMFHGSTEHYASVGTQMADFVSHAAGLANVRSPKVLELPCGYGRVTRQLVTRFDPAQIHVADIMVPAVDFCAEEFGVHAYSIVDPVYEFKNVPDEFFDVAALGSLITHLSGHNARTVMKHFLRKLKPGGVAVVTTHGERSREILGTVDCYQVGDAARTHLLASYDAGQYGFVNYMPDHSLEAKTVDYIGDSYGIALIPHQWVSDVCRENDVEIAEYRRGGWDNHQDVFFISRK
ncbi:class I SAM-dependent methyltransferase [Paraburkholderia caledonica]|uniref:class I SAM-dependent methyltransferase n=1 Tax=Paraburkholderia caledonica TaxID=134536 RepID=UPI000B3FD949|nr:class I SAM-dependent methyltransferase [Paraburkholderia caledonica]